MSKFFMSPDPPLPPSRLSTRVCLRAHEGNHIISEAMITIAR